MVWCGVLPDCHNSLIAGWFGVLSNFQNPPRAVFKLAGSMERRKKLRVEPANQTLQKKFKDIFPLPMYDKATYQSWAVGKGTLFGDQSRFGDDVWCGSLN